MTLFYRFIGVLFYQGRAKGQAGEFVVYWVAVNLTSWFPVVGKCGGESEEGGGGEGATYSHATYKWGGGKEERGGTLEPQR